MDLSVLRLYFYLRNSSGRLGPTFEAGNKPEVERCKEKAIHNALNTNDLEPMKVSSFRDFPFNG